MLTFYEILPINFEVPIPQKFRDYISILKKKRTTVVNPNSFYIAYVSSSRVYAGVISSSWKSQGCWESWPLILRFHSLYTIAEQGAKRSFQPSQLNGNRHSNSKDAKVSRMWEHISPSSLHSGYYVRRKYDLLTLFRPAVIWLIGDPFPSPADWTVTLTSVKVIIRMKTILRHCYHMYVWMWNTLHFFPLWKIM